jgi:hypothetical protein
MASTLHAPRFTLYGCSGQSLIEVLVAVVIGTVMVMAAVSVIGPALQIGTGTSRATVAAALGKELAENVRVFAEADWHNLYFLAKTSSTKYYLTTASSPFTAATSTESLLDDGIVTGRTGYWKLDEGSGSSTVDASGLGRTATLYNDVAWATGKIGGALSFGGVTGQVVVASSTDLRYQGGDMTISLWVKPDATDDGAYLISKPWNGSGQYNYYLTLSGGANPTVTLFLGGATTYSLSSIKTIASGSWHQVTVTLSASNVATIYFDGIPANSGTHSIASWVPTLGDANNLLVLGCVYPYASNQCAGTTTYDLKGSLDDVRIYNRALSATEAQTLYRAGVYTRYFFVDNVSRDGGGDITTSGGADDPSTQKVTVVTVTPQGANLVLVQYLTRYRARSYWQTDWAGGPGQSSSLPTVGNAFATSSNIDYATTTGSIRINNL